MENKQKKNKGVIILLILFCIYLIVEVSYSNGYLEYENYQKQIITEEAMKRFEEDVNNGKDISINDYISVNNKDYSSRTSRISASIGKKIENFIDGGFKDILKTISKFFS